MPFPAIVDAIASSGLHRDANPEAPEEPDGREPCGHHHLLCVHGLRVRRDRPAAGAGSEIGDLAVLQNLRAFLPESPSQGVHELLGAHVPVDPRVQPGDDVAAIERRLELEQPVTIELVRLTTLVPQLTQAAKDLPVLLQSAGRPGDDDEAGGVRLEVETSLAVAVVELERPPVQDEQGTNAVVEAGRRGATPEVPEPTHE